MYLKTDFFLSKLQGRHVPFRCLQLLAEERLPVSKSEFMLKAGFERVRSKGSQYMKGKRRVVVPFHGEKSFHPKIVKQVVKAIETAENERIYITIALLQGILEVQRQETESFLRNFLYKILC